MAMALLPPLHHNRTIVLAHTYRQNWCGAWAATDQQAVEDFLITHTGNNAGGPRDPWILTCLPFDQHDPRLVYSAHLLGFHRSDEGYVSTTIADLCADLGDHYLFQHWLFDCKPVRRVTMPALGANEYNSTTLGLFALATNPTAQG